MTPRPMTIPAQQLTLQPITEKDRDNVLDILTHPQVGETFLVPDYSCREDADRTFQALARLSADRSRFVYGMFLGDELVGFLNETEVSEDSIELGYTVNPCHQNRGYATQALTAAIRVLLDMGFPRVTTAAFEENIASIRVMEKSGMTRTSLVTTLSYRGREHRCVWFEKRR